MSEQKVDSIQFLLNECLEQNHLILQLHKNINNKDKTIADLNKKIENPTEQIKESFLKSVPIKTMVLSAALHIFTGALFGLSAGIVFKQFIPF